MQSFGKGSDASGGNEKNDFYRTILQSQRPITVNVALSFLNRKYRPVDIPVPLDETTMKTILIDNEFNRKRILHFDEATNRAICNKEKELRFQIMDGSSDQIASEVSLKDFRDYTVQSIYDIAWQDRAVANSTKKKVTVKIIVEDPEDFTGRQTLDLGILLG